jgi:sugar/nucleoside kinase (ribokinase family)
MLFEPGMADPKNLIILVGGDHVVLTVDVGSGPMRLGEAAIADIMRPGFLYTTLNRVKRLRAGSLAGAALCDAFRRCGRQLVFDLDVEGFAPEDTPLLCGAAAVILNRAGFERSFGTSDVGQVQRWIDEHEVGLLVRTLDADGAEIFDGKTRRMHPAFPVPVVDVTGAGDAFGGALVYGLANGIDLDGTLELAVTAAAHAVAVEGPQGGVASLEALRDFAALHGRPWGGAPRQEPGA